VSSGGAFEDGVVEDVPLLEDDVLEDDVLEDDVLEDDVLEDDVFVGDRGGSCAVLRGACPTKRSDITIAKSPIEPSPIRADRRVVVVFICSVFLRSVFAGFDFAMFRSTR
jgi:hypothetical protein